MLLLDHLELRLERLQRLHLAGLLHGQRDHRGADDNGEGYDGQAEVAEEDRVEQHEAVDHRTDDHLIPYRTYEFHQLRRPALASRISNARNGLPPSP